MTFFLRASFFSLFLASQIFFGMHTLVYAQACSQTNPCPAGQKCWSTGGAPAQCVPDVCTPACGAGQSCLLGVCIATPSGGGTTGGQQGGGGTTGGQQGGGGTTGGGGLENPLHNIDSLPDLLQAVLRGVVQIGSIILVLALVYVGFLFVVAQGNEEKIRSARSALMWTVIGGLILLGAEAIGLVIKATVEPL